MAVVIAVGSLQSQESRAIAVRTARCRCKFRYVSNFTVITERRHASGAKASTEHLESCLEVIQDHAFWDH